MLGWLKKRERSEHIKLLKQNDLAAQYLCEIAENASELGDSSGDELATDLHLVGFAARNQLSELISYHALPPEKFTEQINVNKQLRRIYDQVLMGRRQFAKQFGSASEKLERFDVKFCPNEGWKVFVDHFGESMEGKLRGAAK